MAAKHGLARLLLALQSAQLRALALLFVALTITTAADAKRHRSGAAKAAFQREQPCPSTGQHRGKCPGFVIDHRQALCVGGADDPSNMHWATIAAAKAKDRWECKPGWEMKLRDCDLSGLCYVLPARN